MFDIGLPEMLVLVVITLLVVGPKDLPRVIRGFARFIARMRRMVDDFMGSVNDYVRESELAEFKEAMEKTRAAVDPKKMATDYFDPTGQLQQAVNTGKPATNAEGSAPATDGQDQDTKPASDTPTSNPSIADPGKQA